MIVSLDRLRKRYGALSAVNDVSLEIAAGEFFSLLGASGSGKSTLLRLIAGLEQPDSGRVLLDGQDATAMPAYARPINTVFQSYALFPHLDVWDNVAYGLRREAVPAEERRHRVGAALAMVSLTGLERRKPHELSGGQQQRVAICRAIVKQPKVLLLDEPMAALDRRLREQTRYELKSLQHRLGITFLMVTHDQEEAIALSSRLAVLDHGRVVQVGTPREVYAQPSSEFVARFIGEANLIAATVAAVDRGAVDLRLDAGGSPVRVQTTRAAAVGDRLTLVLRPEQLSLGGTDGTNALVGTVENISFLGGSSLIRLRIADGLVIEMRLGHQPTVAVGARVTVGWPSTDGVLLPAHDR